MLMDGVPFWPVCGGVALARQEVDWAALDVAALEADAINQAKRQAAAGQPHSSAGQPDKQKMKISF